MQVKNEMGVIVVFTQQAKEAGFELVSIGAEYPDAVIKWKGQEYRVEFEFRSSNFYSHGHDIRNCDLIICWLDDCPDNVLPVLALTSPDWTTKGFTPISQEQKEIAYWKRKAIALERQVQELNGKLSGLQALSTDPAGAALRAKQEKAVKMAADGFTNEEIAKALKVSLASVKNYKKANRLMADPADAVMTTGGQNGNHRKGG